MTRPSILPALPTPAIFFSALFENLPSGCAMTTLQELCFNFASTLLQLCFNFASTSRRHLTGFGTGHIPIVLTIKVCPHAASQKSPAGTTLQRAIKLNPAAEPKKEKANVHENQAYYRFLPRNLG
jgi:hypothetical protein